MAIYDIAFSGTANVGIGVTLTKDAHTCGHRRRPVWPAILPKSGIGGDAYYTGRAGRHTA